ncbi:MAG TPA: DNA alkylation repair protein [Urbifossiella sp.]|nr:DNA alkylation repair protein [Urbifossiella sp.]
MKAKPTATAKEVVEELRALGSEGYRKVLRNHGVPDPMFGVKIADLKNIEKRVKKDYRLALDLYDTGIYDARYLAGLIADETKMTETDLRHWLATADCGATCEYVVARVAAETEHGRELALEWIDAADENAASAGWMALASVVSITDDADLDLDELKGLLVRVGESIHAQPNRVRYAMNAFVIAAGSYVKALTALAIKTGKAVGEVEVDMGKTACKVPFAPDYIQAVKDRGTIGKKRKSARC